VGDDTLWPVGGLRGVGGAAWALNTNKYR
jgi:hypothetical protein